MTTGRHAAHHGHRDRTRRLRGWIIVLAVAAVVAVVAGLLILLNNPGLETAR